METSKTNVYLVYLVGPKGSIEANSFELITNSLTEAQKALEALMLSYEGGEMKTVVVKARGSKGV